MTQNTNATQTFELAREAARRWRLAGEHGDAGDATAVVALVHADRTLEFDATVERKKDETEERFSFSVRDMAEPYWNNDGSKDTRKMAARTACLASRLFGIEEMDNAIKQRIARTVKIAIYLLNSCSEMSDEELFNAVTIKSGKLVVPHQLVRPEPKEDASDNEKAIYEAMRGKPLVLDGRDKASLAELGRRANPPRADRAAGENKESGASFNASLRFVSAIVHQQLDESAQESEVALNTEQRRELFKLAQAISAYFAADPLEDEEVQPIAANA